ncbi:MAG: hypothetical protein IT238_01530 [Bacteroidia bacterium]|nr:hypothetical protein [Bacteroidia bacterium]MCZ2247657.1 hypothetical protein [Bacteroidia bacterium]
MKLSFKLNLIIAVAVSSLLFSCKGNSKSDTDEVDPTAVENQSKAAKVFYAIPSPSELSAIIKATGANFNKSILNPPANQSKYTSIIQMSMNLGVYGADLSYTSTFDQTQEAMAYMGVCKKLADGLGITGAINENTVKRMEKNLNNKDSLLSIISDTYLETDVYLKNNDRAGVSALVVAGGWIEGLYISTSIAEQNAKNEAIIKRIAEQKLILENLIGLLESNEADENIPEIMTDLKALKGVFDNIKMTEVPEAEVKTDTVNKKTVIGSNGELSLSPEQLKDISTRITAIRNKIVN